MTESAAKAALNAISEINARTLLLKDCVGLNAPTWRRSEIEQSLDRAINLLRDAETQIEMWGADKETSDYWESEERYD